MKNGIEFQFARLHFDYGLTAQDLASVYLLPLKTTIRILERAKVKENLFLQRLAKVVFEPQGCGNGTLSDT